MPRAVMIRPPTRATHATQASVLTVPENSLRPGALGRRSCTPRRRRVSLSCVLPPQNVRRVSPAQVRGETGFQIRLPADGLRLPSLGGSLHGP